MNKNFLYVFLAGVLFAIGCYLCFFLGQSYPKNFKEKIVKDTLVIRDTIIIKEPIEKIRWKEKDKLVYIPIVDTLIIHKNDTAYIAMQEEKVEYEDKEYKAVISGIHPKLEEISVYPKNIYITETKKEIFVKHWNFNITAGPAIIYDFNDKKIRSGAGILFGFGYSF